MIRLRRVLDAEQDRGLTLTELVMGMAITSLALLMVGTFFTSITRSTTDNRGERDATGAAANAVDEVGRVIRSAADFPVADGAAMPAIVTGSGAVSISVLSWTDVDPQNPVPTKVAFAVDGTGNVVETRVAGVLVSGYWKFTGLTTTRTLPGPLALSFTYWDDSVAGADPTQVLPTTDALSASVSSVRVVIIAPKKGWGISDPVVLRTTALMPNTTTT